MRIEYISINEIKEYENNPRENEKAIPFVAKSIKEYGFKVPIIIDKEKVVIAGHTRLKAAFVLGMKEVPCIIADDLTADQVTAFRIIDNKVAELSAWDFEKLDDELFELRSLGVNMADFGFSSDEENIDIDDLFDTPVKEENKKTKTIVCEHCGEEFEV